jgi:hypothetical protein
MIVPDRINYNIAALEIEMLMGDVPEECYDSNLKMGEGNYQKILEIQK